MRKEQSIPTVQLYGEQSWQQTPDYLHCEALITRSREHHFKIRPHRHPGITQVFYLRAGSGEANIDGQTLQVKAPMLILISQMSVHDFRWSPDVAGTVLSVATTRLERSGQPGGALVQTALVRLLSEEPLIEQLMDMLLQEYRRTPDKDRDQALQSLIDLLAINIARLQPGQVGEQPHRHRGQEHLQQFLDLVNQDYVMQRTVESYARELGITAPYLNQLCRELTGRHALQIMHERIVLEARRYLIYTALRVSEIAYQLGFADPAYFTRFFRRLSGQSPREFRQQQRDQTPMQSSSAGMGRPSR
ncbi:AraC family transcriptional regulator [Marinobacterium zhoushanense]|uniref:AraC family transcriptional regulator n=1 Tax=Marinobacterium zhoushanense TaxID=1679163 RepID=A0ABQ1K7N3_9GAMM|nr:helix-turn-helix domain-containing protein [Marinobacterium zhoushanense]GGB85948.1 AraC family transcriptional regulator [Marinobacterium zhoushanense]